jgi:hypothetical protein
MNTPNPWFLNISIVWYVVFFVWALSGNKPAMRPVESQPEVSETLSGYFRNAPRPKGRTSALFTSDIWESRRENKKRKVLPA